MKNLLWILLAIALVALLAGVLNHETEVSVDYLVGSTPGFSVFWIGVGLAAALMVAGLAGWSVGRAAASETRRKLEKELEATYRRLREAEARAPLPVVASADVPAGTGAPAAPAPADEARTIVTAGTVDESPAAELSVADDEATTAVESPSGDAAVTAVAPAPDEAVTAIAPVPDDEAATAVTAGADEPGEEPTAAGPPADDGDAAPER